MVSRCAADASPDPQGAAGARQPPEKERFRFGPLYSGLGTVFCQPSGAPMSRQQVHKHFKEKCEQAGLGRDWQPRETRHTTVSLLDDAGTTIEDISALTRHKNPQITRVTYRHQISRAPVARTAAAMDRINLAASEDAS